MFDLNKFNFKVISENHSHGIFELSPLPKGYGYTISNLLRRVLLSSIEGTGIVWVKVGGVYHEYTSLKGVSDDILKVIMNLKNVVFECTSNEVEVVKLDFKGHGVVRASDITINSKVRVINKDFVITELLDPKSKLNIEIALQKGVGYKLAEEETRKEVGLIPLDTNYSPIELVNVKIDKARVGQSVDLDKITLEIKTNGSISPLDAFRKSADICKMFVEHLYEVANGKVFEEKKSEVKTVKSGKAIDLSVDKLNVSTRLYNCLVKANISSLNQLSGKTKKEVYNLKGLGDKSKKELMQLLEKYNIEIVD